MLGTINAATRGKVTAVTSTPSRPAPNPKTSPSPSPSASQSQSQSQSPSAAVVRLTAAQKAQVGQLLTESTNHYDQLMAGGKRALGTTQYDTPQARLDAFGDPNSAASRFSAWRKSSDAERDLTYTDVFKAADAVYNAQNEPGAISKWRSDVGTAQGRLTLWVQAADEWQIKRKTPAELAAAEQAVSDAMTKVRADIAQVLAAT